MSENIFVSRAGCRASDSVIGRNTPQTAWESAGWAKNEYDGSVEMEAQGTEEAINRMLVMINRSDYIVIDSIETKEVPLLEDERSFYVR